MMYERETDESLVQRAKATWQRFRRLERSGDAPDVEAAMKDASLNYVPALVEIAERLLAEVKEMRNHSHAVSDSDAER